MDTHFDIIFITNIPSFYKINLFNKINSRRKIFVIFTHDKSVQRNNDFYSGNMEFKHIILSNGSYLRNVLFLFKLIFTTRYNTLIIGGWDQLFFWISAFISKKKKNSVWIESSLYESKVTGITRLIKKVFLSRISKAFVSGKSQSDLCKALDFNGQIIITKGVGIFNVIQQPLYKYVSIVKNFIYVGRLSNEKNLLFLIETFNLMPSLNLNIVGFGPMEKKLKEIAKSNITFHGAVPNSELFKFYQLNDIFILPSISEPWGLVVEEALNNGLPVIVSNKVGCVDEIINENNGIVFQISDMNSLKNAIEKIQDPIFYNTLRLNISKINYDEISSKQVAAYLL